MANTIYIVIFLGFIFSLVPIKMSLTNGFESQNWSTNTSGLGILQNPGDIYYYKNNDDRLPVGTNGQVLQVNTSTTGNLNWVNVSSLGSSIDHNTTTNKQGGNGVDEFYHLTQTDHDNIVAGTLTATTINEETTDDGVLVESAVLLKDSAIRITNASNALILSESTSSHYIISCNGTLLKFFRETSVLSSRDLPTSTTNILSLSANGAINMPVSTSRQNIQSSGGLDIINKHSSQAMKFYTWDSLSVNTERISIQSGSDTASISFKNSNLDSDGSLSIDTINEKTATNGVTIDGHLIKDGNLDTSSAQTLTIGSTTQTKLELSRATIDTEIMGDLLLPTSGGTQTALNHYEENTFTTNWSGPWASAQAGNATYTLIGKKVTMNIPEVKATTNGGTSIISDSSVPTRITPSADIKWAIVVDNSVTKILGTITLYQSTGTFEVHYGVTSGTFTGAGGSEGFEATSISWTTQ